MSTPNPTTMNNDCLMTNEVSGVLPGPLVALNTIRMPRAATAIVHTSSTTST